MDKERENPLDVRPIHTFSEMGVERISMEFACPSYKGKNTIKLQYILKIFLISLKTTQTPPNTCYNRI